MIWSIVDGENAALGDCGAAQGFILESNEKVREITQSLARIPALRLL